MKSQPEVSMPVGPNRVWWLPSWSSLQDHLEWKFRVILLKMLSSIWWYCTEYLYKECRGVCQVYVLCISICLVMSFVSKLFLVLCSVQFVVAEIQFIKSTMLYYLCQFTLKKLLKLKADKRCLIRPYILYFALRRGIR